MNYPKIPCAKGLMSFLCFILFFSNVRAQVQTARYEAIPKTNSKGYYEYLPKGYDANGTQTYPLIIFVHGIGELGDGSASQLGKVLANGTPRQINQRVFPDSFIVNGKSYKFIVLSPQFTYWPGPTDIKNIIDFAIGKYKVDASRVYLTGLSMGGGVVWEFAGNSDANAKKVAAIVPISGASYPDVTRANVIAAANLPVWATTNSNDPSVDEVQTIGYVTNINKAPVLPNPLAKLTVFQATGHDAWTKTYDLNFRENSMNVYEWMLQYKRNNENIWLGTISSVWENPLNWSALTVPDSGTDVIINTGITVLNFPVVSSNASVKSLRVNNGASFTVNSGYKFTIVK